MKINKEFAPITIILETVEEKESFLSILDAAHRKRTDSWFGRNPYGDKLVYEIEDIQRKLS